MTSRATRPTSTYSIFIASSTPFIPSQPVAGERERDHQREESQRHHCKEKIGHSHQPVSFNSLAVIEGRCVGSSQRPTSDTSDETDERIHGEWLKVGIDVSQATVAKYMTCRRRPPSPTWKTFLANHVGPIMAADFIVVPTATRRLLVVLVILAHERRRVIHIAVTDRPTARGPRNSSARPFRSAQRPAIFFAIRDHACADWSQTAKAMDTHEVVTAPRSPWQNAYVERFIGAVRRECLDHVIVCSKTALRRTLQAYTAYYLRSRTHLALAKDAPVTRPVVDPAEGAIVAVPQVGGLHHRYERRAASALRDQRLRHAGVGSGLNRVRPAAESCAAEARGCELSPRLAAHRSAEQSSNRCQIPDATARWSSRQRQLGARLMPLSADLATVQRERGGAAIDGPKPASS